MQNELILSDRLKAQPWELNLRQNDTTSVGGESLTVEHGSPYWTFAARYDNLTEGSYENLMAWIDRREGSGVLFTAYPAHRKVPRLNPTASNSGLELSAYTPSTGEITINRPLISVGDFVSWIDTTGAQFCGRVSNVVSSGGSSTRVRTKPYARAPHASNPQPRVDTPVARFKLIPSTLTTDNRADGISSVSFSARQEEKR